MGTSRCPFILRRPLVLLRRAIRSVRRRPSTRLIERALEQLGDAIVEPLPEVVVASLADVRRASRLAGRRMHRNVRRGVRLLARLPSQLYADFVPEPPQAPSTHAKTGGPDDDDLWERLTRWSWG